MREELGRVCVIFPGIFNSSGEIYLFKKIMRVQNSRHKQGPNTSQNSMEQYTLKKAKNRGWGERRKKKKQRIKTKRLTKQKTLVFLRTIFPQTNIKGSQDKTKLHSKLS